MNGNFRDRMNLKGPDHMIGNMTKLRFYNVIEKIREKLKGHSISCMLYFSNHTSLKKNS